MSNTTISTPTDRQVGFATEIAEALDLPLPDEYTGKAYQEFINDNLRDFNERER